MDTSDNVLLFGAIFLNNGDLWGQVWLLVLEFKKKVIQSVPQRRRGGLSDLRKESFSSVEKVCMLEKVHIYWKICLVEKTFK